MVKQYTENQYDDDLTVGTDGYDDSYYTGSVDFFEFSNDEESPISRLKSLILSIDWEITDEILVQFNEELVDLRDIWSGERINLVYVQALEKISKYIYQKKADSHPSAIKLLLTLYHNLEKIILSVDLTEEQKKEILLEDVKRFESLKRHIGKQSETVDDSQSAQLKLQKQTKDIGTEGDLLNLRAIVLGIDWEITDQDLNKLRKEVVRLETKFADSRPRLILLQGIGTLGAYIKLKKSNAHADAFKLLHLFYESLEKIVTTPMKLEEEKAILFPAVERFNSFKTLLGPTIAPEAINRDEKEIDQGDSPVDSFAIAPAFADLPEEELIGFQAEEVAKTMGFESSGSVDNHIESFFMGSNFQRPEAPIHIDVPGTAYSENHEIALQGVDVEVDDEEEADVGVVSEGETLAPALSVANEQKSEIEPPSPAFHGEELDQDTELVGLKDSLGLAAEEFSDTSGDFDFTDEDEESAVDFSKLDRDIVLQGVDVESEADDDSDEEALAMMGGELAPALADNDEVSIYGTEIIENSAIAETVEDEIAGTLGRFFDEEIESHLFAAAKGGYEGLDVTSIAVGSENVEREIDSSSDSLPIFDLEQTAIEDQDGEGKIGEDDFATLAMEGVIFREEEPVTLVDDNPENLIPETEPEGEDEAIAFVSELELGESLDAFFGDSDFEQRAEESLVEGQEDNSTEIDEQLDSFFDLGEGVEESEEDRLLFTLPEETIGDIVTVEADVVPRVLDNTEEDEVVFELAEEVDELFDGEPDIGKVEETSFKGLLAAEENIAPALETDKAAATYGSLQACVESLGIELDDKVILGLWGVIDHLHLSLADKPLEKTFLQLLSTITRHIDQNRYDSSTDAYVLLQSVCSALTELQKGDLHQNQEMLLTETHKVLTWQDELLARAGSKK